MRFRPTRMQRRTLKIQEALVRHETFEGRDHLVVPCVMIVGGVLNGAFVPVEEMRASVEAWNGRPAPILHPKQGDEYVSANDPKVIEQNVVGQVFAARVDGDKLKAELWIDIEKAKKLGHERVLADLQAGKPVEVSTGYFADDEPTDGEFNGVAYSTIHRNLRPDHLALLPGEIGACSVADGCGAPRVNFNHGPQEPINNEEEKMSDKPKVKLGDKAPCEPCEKLKEFHANGAISAKQLETLQEMAESIGVEHMKTLVDVLGSLTVKAEPPKDEPEKEEEPEAMTEPVPVPAPAPSFAANEAMIKQLVEKALTEALPAKMTEVSRRADVEARLKASERNTLTVNEMRSMPIEVLEKLEGALRPADYSGQGGFVANENSKSEPLPLPRGLLG